MNNQLTVYTVSIHDGDTYGYFVRREGKNGVITTDNINKAKIHRNIGPARSLITALTKNLEDWPNVTRPKLVVITSSKIEFVDESERVAKVIAADKAKAEKRIEDRRKEAIKRAEEEFERAKLTLDKAKKDVF